jgi:hypothetical protein
MLLEQEVSLLQRVGLLPQAESWRDALAKSARCLRRWVLSADTFALWVRDYGQVCRSLNELNAQTELLSGMLRWQPGPDSVERDFIVRAIDKAVDRIGNLAGTIDAELRRSAVNAEIDTDTAACPQFPVFSAA